VRMQWIGPFCQRTGYGQATHDYLMALRRVGVDIRIQPIIDCESEHLDERYQELLEFSGFHEEKPDAVVVHAIPRFAHEFVTGDLRPHPEVKRVCLTTWETTKFPTEDAQTLYHNFDMVIVPSSYTADVFAKAYEPLGKKVRVIPHTFDSQWWADMPQPHDRFRSDGNYIFYSIGVWSERKNPIGLLKAYLSEFKGSEPVVLRMVTPFVVEDDVITLARCMNLDDLPKVEFFGRWGTSEGRDGRLSETDLKSLHYQSDCYVTLARAEGWGLGAFEAAILGKPVIATQFSGLCDFLDRYPNCFSVPCFMTPAVAPEVAVGKAFEIGGIKITPQSPMVPVGISGDQMWAEPDLASAKMLMRRCFAWRQGSMSNPNFPLMYGYEAVGNLFKRTLENLCNG